MALLDEVMQADTAGDPMSDQKWSRKDTRSISREMNAHGVRLCPNTAGKLLKHRKYSLRVNRKSIAETQHPDRNRQFELIADFRKRFEDAGSPILSMDTKKKELIGNFKNEGRAWSRESELVNQHDFRSHASAITSPYGLYEPVRNRGTIVIGTSADTPEFAVDCLDRWISEFGWTTYPSMKEILLLCDSGGSNGYRPRFWKYGLYQTIAQAQGITVTVCHYPPGASKWNPVEHRLFSFISLEWAGHPLRSLEAMIRYIQSTTTKTGLKVTALVNEREYAKGKKVPDHLFKEIRLSNHSELPAWNYTIRPN
jgi:Rhodopirellula transposase DDE domain